MQRLRMAQLGVIGAGLLCAASGGAFGQATGQQGRTGACDRACLAGIADAYLAAVAAHDPSAAPMAPDARFTENTQVLAVGDGLWKTASRAPTAFKIYVPDPVARQIGAIVMMEEAGTPVQVALRLKVEDRRITEAEHLVVRSLSGNQLANLQTPRTGLLATVPPGERLPRDIMLLFLHAYYDAIEQSDGDVAPFADDCMRRENGMTTAAPPAARAAAAPPPGAPVQAGGQEGRGGGMILQGCREQLETRAMSYIESIDLRRVAIADEEKGLVFGLSMFRHPMREKTLTILNADGTRGQRTMAFDPFDLPAAHILKIRAGRIREIEAMGFTMPLYSKNGWSEFTR